MLLSNQFADDVSISCFRYNAKTNKISSKSQTIFTRKPSEYTLPSSSGSWEKYLGSSYHEEGLFESRFGQVECDGEWRQFATWPPSQDHFNRFSNCFLHQDLKPWPASNIANDSIWDKQAQEATWHKHGCLEKDLDAALARVLRPRRLNER